MAYNTVLSQGSFISDGNSKVIRVPSDLDWMEVINFTRYEVKTENAAPKSYWFRGMEPDSAIADVFDASNALTTSSSSSGGFTLVNSASDAEFAPPVAITSSTNVPQPVFTVASTAALSTGDRVLVNLMSGQVSLNGYEFEIEVLNGTTFRPRYAFANAPGVAGTGGYYSVRLNPPLFSPYRYTVANITASSSPVVTFTASHGFSVNDVVRVSCPDVVWGKYQQLSNQQATVTAITAGTITLSGVDTSSYGTFVFPSSLGPVNAPFTPASAIVFGGQNRSANEINNGYIGMKLGGGLGNPAGEQDDKIYWIAGKSFSVNNE